MATTTVSQPGRSYGPGVDCVQVLTVGTAVDRYVALVLPEMYRRLVIERDWPPADYEKWLGET